MGSIMPTPDPELLTWLKQYIATAVSLEQLDLIIDVIKEDASVHADYLRDPGSLVELRWAIREKRIELADPTPPEVPTPPAVSQTSDSP